MEADLKNYVLKSEIKRRFGGSRGLANHLGITESAVSGWIRNGFMPYERAKEVDMLAFTKQSMDATRLIKPHPNPSIDNLTIGQARKLYEELKQLFEGAKHEQSTPNIRASTEAVDATEGDGRASA